MNHAVSRSENVVEWTAAQASETESANETEPIQMR